MSQTRIAFVNGKGGVGKTTVTTLLAVAFQQTSTSVCIDDRDPQLSATTAAGIFGIPLGENRDVVMIDTAPSIHSPATLDAIQTADLVLVVTSPSPLDLATTAATARWIKTERPTGLTYLLFNLVQTNNRFFQEMSNIAKQMPFPAFQNYLVRRTCYQVAQLNGWKSIPPDAREEVLKVALEVVRALPASANSGSHHQTNTQ